MSNTTNRIIAYECRQLILNIRAKLQGKLPPQLLLQVPKLEKETGLLEQTWSEFASRNLLSEILRIIKVMEPLLPDNLPSAAAGIKRRVTKALGEHNPTNSKYQNVICLGYRVKTAFDKFKGDVDDWEDMKKKCEDMKTAIRAAYQLANAHHADGTMLKVFMAPEFFFRGINGAYDHADISGQVARKAEPGISEVKGKRALMDIMGDEINQDIYKDWLFVLGTAIAATKLTQTVCAQCSGELEWKRDSARKKTRPVCKSNSAHSGTQEKVLGAFVDNIAFIQKEKQHYIVTKELVSHIDYVTSSVVKDKVTVRGEQLDVIRHAQSSTYDTASNKPTKFQDERMGGGIFIMDGVTIGLEVCLDHAATTTSDTGGRLSNASNIQIQLVPSAGMTISALRTKSGGIVFNVDGSGPHVQVVGSGAKPEIRYDQGSNFFKNTANVDWADAVDEFENITLSDWAAVTAPKECTAPNGSIICYGPYALP